MGQAVIAIVRTLSATVAAIRELEKALGQHFDAHPDAPILHSMPGLGVILGARLLGELVMIPPAFPMRAAAAPTPELPRSPARREN